MPLSWHISTESPSLEQSKESEKRTEHRSQRKARSRRLQPSVAVEPVSSARVISSRARIRRCEIIHPPKEREAAKDGLRDVNQLEALRLVDVGGRCKDLTGSALRLDHQIAQALALTIHRHDGIALRGGDVHVLDAEPAVDAVGSRSKERRLRGRRDDEAGNDLDRADAFFTLHTQCP